MRDIKIICLFGNKGVGKSTVAKKLGEIKGWKWISFASPMRDMMEAAFGPEYGNRFADKECPRPELGGKSIRHAMMTLGTEWGRDMIDENIWVNSLLYRIENSSQKYFVIDDLRMPNEYDRMLAKGATFVRLRRNEADERSKVELTELIKRNQMVHKSERYWPSFTPDFTCQNEDLLRTVDEIYNFCTTCE